MTNGAPGPTRNNAKYFGLLITNPKAFLAKYPLVVSGRRATEPSGAYRYVLNSDDAPARQSGIRGLFSAHPGRRIFLQGEDRVTKGSGSRTEVLVHYVAVQPSSDYTSAGTGVDFSSIRNYHVGVPTLLTGEVLNGHLRCLIVTTQLSGCTFCYRQLGDGTLLVAHIQPRPPEYPGSGAGAGGRELQTAIQAGHFRGNPTGPIQTYGMQDYDPDPTNPRGSKATVIGIWQSDRWDLYWQINDGTAGVRVYGCDRLALTRP